MIDVAGTLPGHVFVMGMAHPLSGSDHILAMLAVGIWSAAVGGQLAVLT